MNNDNIFKVREMIYEDIEYFVKYWLDASLEYLTKLGVDINKRPKKEQLVSLVSNELNVAVKSKKNYFLIWLINNKPVGYSNINQIEYGKQAFMHLHLWQTENRQKGIGTAFIEKSLPFYFDNFDLQVLFCEPYALNPAPNKVVEKLGFEFVKTYKTIPGASNFEQLVNQWKFSRINFKKMKNL